MANQNVANVIPGGLKENEMLICSWEQAKSLSSKILGKIHLTNFRFVFVPSDSSKSAQRKVVPLSFVTKCLRKEKAVKVMLEDGHSVKFGFISAEGEKGALNDSDNFQFLIEKAITVLRDKTQSFETTQLTPQQQHKIAELGNNPDLKKLHQDLVAGGILSESEFWYNVRLKRSPENKFSNVRQVTVPRLLDPGIRPGVSPCFLSDIRSSELHAKTTDGQINIKLTSSLIKTIFKMYPSVEKKYKDNVPLKYTEKQFWTKFMQSNLFYEAQQKGLVTSAISKDVFSDVHVEEERNYENKLKEKRKHAQAFNIKDGMVDEGYVEKYGIGDEMSGAVHAASDLGNKSDRSSSSISNKKKKPGNNDARLLVVRKINRQSGQVVPESRDSGLDDEMLQLSEQTDMSYLNRAHDENVVGEELNLKDPSQYCKAFVKLTRDGEETQLEKTLSDDSGGGSSNPTNVRKSAADWEPEISRVGSLLNAEKTANIFGILGKSLQIGRKSSSSKRVVDDGTSNPDVVSRLLRYQRSVNELLRHFWGLLPATSCESASKVIKIVDKLKMIRATIVKKITKLTEVQRQLFQGILFRIDKAEAEYKNIST